MSGIRHLFPSQTFFQSGLLALVAGFAQQGEHIALVAFHPSLVLNIPAIDEHSLGYLIYFFEKACAISGYLLGVNPFDQPEMAQANSKK